MNLPKRYLSFSQLNLWQRNKDSYRKRYYMGIPHPMTEEMKFGKRVAKLLEGDVSEYPTLSKVPRLPVMEYKIETEIEGVPIMGFVDSFSLDKLQFLEYKTAHTDRNGKEPWDIVRVHKHDQLPFYALMIEAVHGGVDDKCELIWLETEFKKDKQEFDGHTLEAQTRQLRLTGRIERFERVIPKWERGKMAEYIREVALEIEDDFKRYLSLED